MMKNKIKEREEENNGYFCEIKVFISDPLLLQIMLTRIFDQNFEKQNITVYERFRDVAEKYIKEPFLKEPLLQNYRQIRQKIRY